MLRTLSYSAFNLVLALFPLSTLLAANAQLLREPVTSELLAIGGGCLALFVAAEAVYLVTRRERFVVLLFFGLFLLFLWNPLLGAFGTRGILGIAGYWLAVGAAFALAVRATRSRDFTSVLAFGLGAYAALPLLQLALGSAGDAPERSERLQTRRQALELATSLPEPRVRPNIHLLLFDCTSDLHTFLERVDDSPESRRRIDAFLERIHRLGFVHFEDAWSNYERTDPSLFSFFNFTYHEEGDGFQWYQKYYGFRQSALRLYLRTNGYRIVSAEKDIPCPKEFDACYPTDQQLQLVSHLAASTPFLDLIFKLDKYVFSPLDSNLLRKTVAQLRTRKLEEIEEFLDYVRSKEISEEPEFVFGHFYASHPVNYYDANCDTEQIALFEQRSGENRIEDFSLARYGNEYLCFLDKIAEVSEAILEHDPEAWVFVFSDHGLGAQRWGIHWDEVPEREKLEDTFRILNVVKASPECQQELAAGRSIVNKSRALVNCLVGDRALPYLPDEVDLRYLGVDARIPIEPEVPSDPRTALSP